MKPPEPERPFARVAGPSEQGSTRSGVILDEVLRETVTGSSSAERKACGGDQPETRRCKERSQFNQEAAESLARFATPQWARQLVADEQSWLLLTSETARILLMNEQARMRMERIWSRIGERA